MPSCSIRPCFPCSHGVPSLWLFTVFRLGSETPNPCWGKQVDFKVLASLPSHCLLKVSIPGVSHGWMAPCGSVPASVGSKGNVLCARKPPRSCTRARGCRPGEQEGRYRGKEVLSATSLVTLCPSPPWPHLCKMSAL